MIRDLLLRKKRNFNNRRREITSQDIEDGWYNSNGITVALDIPFLQIETREY
jgi:hypothetical protein